MFIDFSIHGINFINFIDTFKIWTTGEKYKFIA